MKNILVTGGAGYIGSHTVVQLLNKGYNVTVIDNLSNSNKEVIDNIEVITQKTVTFYEVDVNNCSKVRDILKAEKIEAVIHFAAFKAVGESVENPLLYYENNVGGAISVLKAMEELKIYKFIFSSSATVYSKDAKLPWIESSELAPVNPYGNTKLQIEQILRHLALSSNWKIIVLRYFNPLGAHSSGLIGENPKGIPNNLVPYISKVALGELKELKIFGDDYNTVDGTGVRDYVHVLDLADGHILALEKLEQLENNFEVYNLGSEKGFSVYQIISAFEQASSVKIPYKVIERRKGDLDSYYSDSSKAQTQLNWSATRSLAQMCKDTWTWNKNMIKKAKK